MISRRLFTKAAALFAAAPFAFLRRTKPPAFVAKPLDLLVPPVGPIVFQMLPYTVPFPSREQVTYALDVAYPPPYLPVSRVRTRLDDQSRFYFDLLSSWRTRRVETTVPFVVGGEELLATGRVTMTASTSPEGLREGEWDLTIVQPHRTIVIPNFYRRYFKVVVVPPWDRPRQLGRDDRMPVIISTRG